MKSYFTTCITKEMQIKTIRHHLLLLSHSVVSDTFVTPWAVACQASLSMGFSRQEHWSRLLFPSPGDLADPRIKPVSLVLAGRFFTIEPPEKPCPIPIGFYKVCPFLLISAVVQSHV